MKSLTRRKEMISWMWVVICMAMPLAMSLSCCHSRVKIQYIEPLGLYFQIQTTDETAVISFGEKKDSVYANYFETYDSSDCGGLPFYFVIDNTSGSLKVKHIFFPDLIIFFDVHIPDYPYSIDYFISQDTFRDHVRKLRTVSRDSVGSLDHYVVEVWATAYDRYLDYRMYDIGDAEDIDLFIASFTDNSLVIPYPDLNGIGLQTDYQKNIMAYGDPKVSKGVTLTESSRSDMMAYGWLFLDTMDIIREPVLEIDKWKFDDHILSIIYRIGPCGERIPVNGARYPYIMEHNKDRIYYQ